MGNYNNIACFCLQRIILPACLLSSVIIRPIGVSLSYLLLLFYLPFVPTATPKTIKGHTGHYLRAVVCISTILLTAQIAWQITLVSVPTAWYDDWVKECNLIESILRHVGFVSFYNLNYTYVLKWISPEILMFISSVTIYILCDKLCKGLPDEEQQASAPKRKGTFLISVGKYVSLLLLMFTGCLRPSILSAFYYLTFLGAATWWACAKELARGFAVVCKCIMAILLCHILILFAYQTSWILELLPPTNPYARYFGFTQLITMNCTSDPRELEFLDVEWASFLSPIMMVLLYYIIAFESKELLKPQPQKKSGTFSKLESGSLNGSLRRTMSMKLSRNRRTRSTLTQDKWRSATRKVRVFFTNDAAHATESTPLIRAVSPTRGFLSRKSNASGSMYYQDSTGSVTVGPEEGIPMKVINDEQEENDKPSILEHVVYSIASIFQMVIRTSYIATAIIMIVWSITFHSWLAFVFLLWANVIWMVQDQRGFTLRSSPFLVIYAQLLLLAQYIYGMDITEKEIPFQIEEMNMAQIGFERRSYLPCIPLIVKSLYTIMFWVTLRQLMQERKEKKQSSALADMVAPLQVTVGAATAVLDDEQPIQTSPLLKKLGDFLKRLLTKYFICLVAIMLLAIGITGQRMTVFRILYMALFLVFILTFQISRPAWRKMMYGFLVTVIVYSMSILVLIYTYQFDNFPKYWETYLHISHTLQLDIGLERYAIKELFLRLLTPTLFLIMTVVQLHYFHKDLLEISHIKSRNNSVARQDSQGPYSIASSMMGGSSLPPSTPMDKTAKGGTEFVTEGASERHSNNKSTYTHLSSKMDFATWITKFQEIVFKYFMLMWDFIFLFLELHLIKIIMLSTMLLCVFDVCAIHFIFVLIVCIGLLFNTKIQLVLIHFVSTATCILLLCKMIYQIEYIEHSSYSVNCTYANSTNSDNSTTITYNNAEWLGFKKTGEGITLPKLVKGYIALILLFTFRAMVEFRQMVNRIHKHDPTIRPYLMFPRVSRLDADKDLKHFIQYIFNYGFYKFGVETCLMCLVGVIGSRLDVWAVFYSGWLCVLWCSYREKQARLWKWFICFIVVVLPLQYLLIVGIIPELCVEYPWMNANEILQRTRDWMMLPDPTHRPQSARLVCDFILLLLCSRQSLVFRIEKRHGENYKGGSNSDAPLENWESPDFHNPIPDFVTYFRSWLDVIKRMAMMGSLWATLAIMFLTGTNRVNLFSMGYLIGSFVFLWQGTDLYLRPIKSILKWWNWLLGYNVAVIVIKTFLQILGCIFIQYMQDNACWMVQVLGIGCIDKFSGKSFKTFLKMQVPVEDHECSVPREDIGLAWDGVCFGFLLMQRRLFQSYYFLRIVNESKAITILQSRGAELIEELRVKQMSVQDEQEKKILEKIKVKMDRIKANQQKFSGPMFKETTNHFVEENSELKSSLKRSGSNASECLISVRTPMEGYHTPRTPTTPGSPRGYHTPISEEGSPQHVQSPPGPPSPFSALNTVSLDAYLEPRRISFGSPPSSELNPRARSPSESYPVFSPPALCRPSHPATSTYHPHLHTPRHSIISLSGRSQLSHHQYSLYSTSSRPTHQKNSPSTYPSAIRSGDYYMFDEFDDEELDLISEKDTDEEDAKGPSLGEFLSKAMKTDMREATLMRRESLPRQAVRSRLSTRSLRRSPYRQQPSAIPTDPEDVQLLEREPEDPDKSDHLDIPLGSPRESESEVPDKESLWNIVCKYILFGWAFVESFLISLTKWLNKFSRDYRYVARVLTKEKILLKERSDFGIGLRSGSTEIWEPLPSTLMRLKKPRLSDTSFYEPLHVETDPGTSQTAMKRRKESEMSVPEIRILAPSLERGLDLDSPFHLSLSYLHLHRPMRQSSVYSMPSSSDSTTPIEDYDDETFTSDQPTIFRFLFAIWYAILAHTDVVCYFMIFINQIQSAAILSLPLPLMVFLWGTLSIPRPSKTFWVTIIAYTEIIVLVKSMFQYEMLWWNQTVIPSNMPFSAPRIIGIERKSNYALYDLILLLIVFFHRFMLISLGLWKSDPITDHQEDKTYALSTKQLSLIRDGKGFNIGQLFAKKHIEVSSPSKEKGIQLTSDAPGDQEASTAQDPMSSKKSDEENTDEKTNNLSEKEASTAEKVDSSDSPTLEKKGSQELVPYNKDAFAVRIRSFSDEPYKTIPGVIKISAIRYGESIKKFYGTMLDPTSRVKADVYAYMFMCDFFNFMVVIFGFSAFGTQQGDGGVQAYLEENKVPIPFLVMLILQFGLIVIDRALFLRKFILGKLLFQICLIIGVHIWMFFILPAVTERSFNALLPPPMWYMVKCIYLLLSAYQIRCGYPTRILGNFLCKGFNYVNMFLFKGFMMIPFLFELRALMDWIWTDTSMTLMDWLKMEDIFANVFQLKCSRHVESEYPQPRGEKKAPFKKYLVGGSFLAFIIALIWFPLVLFAFGNSVGASNPPYDVTVNIRLGPYLPVYTMSAQSNNIETFNENQWNTLANVYKKDRTAQTFLSNYIYDDVSAIILNGNSTNVWGISPPDIERLREDAGSNDTIKIKFTYTISHKTNSKDNPPIIKEEVDLDMLPFKNGIRNTQRDILIQMLNGNSTQWMKFENMFPKFVKVFNKGEAKPVQQLMDEVRQEKDKMYRDLYLKLTYEDKSNTMWWEAKEPIDDPNHVNYLRHIPFSSNDEQFVMYTFSDKLFPDTLNFISGSGIIGLYTTFVFVASRVLRGFFADICFKIMFEDLPNVDRVLQLCLDIYLVRESRELSLEEDLFAKLVFLYRSPETMIKWTRPKDEEIEDEVQQE